MSIVILVALVAAALAYCTGADARHMGPEKLALHQAIHLTLSGVLCNERCCTKASTRCRSGVGTTICIASAFQNFYENLLLFT